MPTPRWYIDRLRAMSPGELLWRVRSELRNIPDRLLVGRRQRRRPVSSVVRPGCRDARPCLRVTDVPVGELASSSIDGAGAWYAELLAEADAVVDHRLSFFNLTQCDLGDPIDWHRDHDLGKPSPMWYAPSIDYRDAAQAGDAKLVWEPSRHHQFVVLGRAYRASGERRYAKAVIDQLTSWLDANPYGVGMNWRSPLELGIRLINWVWAFDLIRESDVLSGDVLDRVLDSVHRHLWEITRKYSRGSSKNNHLIGEAAGVFVATSAFRGLRGAAVWREQSREILCHEIVDQTYRDGGNREQALGYHDFVMQFFLVAGMVARRSGEDFPESYWAVLERMFEFAAALSDAGPAPMYGDADDGKVLDLGNAPDDVRAFLAVGALLFDRADFATSAGRYSESAYWLFGSEGEQRFARLASTSERRPIRSRAFPDTGLYLLQHDGGEHVGPISVVFDCAELGYGSIAAHGHADALSFVLRAFGVDVFVDPGTYDYFTHPAWREHFRTTRAHNTVVVDGQDQSTMLGPFLWGQRAHARCVVWEPTDDGGMVVGEHDGYTRLDDPVIHRRSVQLEGAARRIVIRDEIEASGSHRVAVVFHLAEHCRVVATDGNRFEVEAGPGRVVLSLDESLTHRTLTGSDDPIGGWVSRGYHRKEASTTIFAERTCDGAATVTCEITLEEAPTLIA